MDSVIKNNGRKKYNFFLFFLFVVGVAVRVIGISDIPGGLNQDEASIGYEAFSILQDGLDRNGMKYPVHLIAWGNGQNALYAYLSIPFIKIWGLTPFSVRIVSALFGCLSLIVFYLLIQSAFDKKRAIYSLMFLVICPWSIMASRWGLESNLFPTLFLTAVCLLFKAMTTRQVYYIPAVCLFAASLYSYGTSYLMVPLFFILIFYYIVRFKKIKWGIGLLSVGIFVLLALPIILFVLVNWFGWDSMHMLGLSVPKLSVNRTNMVFNLFSENIVYTLVKNTVRCLGILFLQTDNQLFNAMPAFGMLYHISLPFLFFGLYAVLKNRKRMLGPINYIMLAWFFCAMVVGITTISNINRLNIIVFPMAYFTLEGFYFIKEQLQEKQVKFFKVCLMLFYACSFLFFIFYYVSFFNKENKSNFFCGFGEAVQYVNEKFPTDTIYVSTHSVNMPYIQVCFFSETDPVVFRETVIYDTINLNGGFRNVLAFDRYRFTPDALGLEKVSIVSKNEFLFSERAKTMDYKTFGDYYVISPVK